MISILSTTNGTNSIYSPIEMLRLRKFKTFRNLARHSILNFKINELILLSTSNWTTFVQEPYFKILHFGRYLTKTKFQRAPLYFNMVRSKFLKICNNTLLTKLLTVPEPKIRFLKLQVNKWSKTKNKQFWFFEQLSCKQHCSYIVIVTFSTH